MGLRTYSVLCLPGDAFFLAFSEPCDAIAFALELQVALHEAQWSDEILATKWACDNGKRRGLRVRVSVNMGPVQTTKNPVTRRTEYIGEGMDVAQELEKFTEGGQILTTADTWNAAFHLADAKLGSPIVSEFHSRTLVRSETDMDSSSVSQSHSHKRIVELIPAALKCPRLVSVKESTSNFRPDYFQGRRSPGYSATSKSDAVLTPLGQTLARV